MSRAPADAFLAAVESGARAVGLAETRALVAVSGGIDSSALLAALEALREPLALELVVGHVHHGLRGAASDADEAFVKDRAGALGLPLAVRRVQPEAERAEGPSRARPTLQEAARKLRREALRAMADVHGCALVATAHHLDDQAETVVMRLLRGAGPDALAGIPPVSPDGRFVRPLLACSRAEIEHFARGRRLPWREDASNADPRFARARLRAVLPELGASINPQWLQAIGRLAEAQHRDSAWIERLLQEEEGRWMAPVTDAEGGWSLVLSGWRDCPDGLALRLARRALRSSGAARDVSGRHLSRVVEFLRTPRTGRRLELPGGLELRCDVTEFRLGRPTSVPGGSEAEC